MTVAPHYPKALEAAKKPKRKRQVLPEPRFYIYGHAKYVVPTPLLKAFIESRVQIDTDWRDTLAMDAASILKQEQVAVIRRLYDVMHNKAMIVNTEVAEALVMALGASGLDEADIPVLPGNHKLAKELVSIRAECAGVELTPFRLAQLAKRTFRVSALIAKYPHHHRMLIPMAPFNCLRPYE